MWSQPRVLAEATTNDLPVVGTNAASGLLAGGVIMGTAGCGGNFSDSRAVFHFSITQQSFGTLGQITISNIQAMAAPYPIRRLPKASLYR